jgi:hypothetical protein
MAGRRSWPLRTMARRRAERAAESGVEPALRLHLSNGTAIKRALDAVGRRSPAGSKVDSEVWPERRKPRNSAAFANFSARILKTAITRPISPAASKKAATT